jgi:hypothetical protein
MQKGPDRGNRCSGAGLGDAVAQRDIIDGVEFRLQQVRVDYRAM